MSWRFEPRTDGCVIMLGEPPQFERFSRELLAGELVSRDGDVLIVRASNATVRYKITFEDAGAVAGELLSWRVRYEATGLGTTEPSWVDGPVIIGEEPC